MGGISVLAQGSAAGPEQPVGNQEGTQSWPRGVRGGSPGRDGYSCLVKDGWTVTLGGPATMSIQLRDLPGGPFPPRDTPIAQDFNSDNLASHTHAHTHMAL